MWSKIKKVLGIKDRPVGKTILIVDDTEVNRTLPERIFSKRGYNVVLAENGVDGITQAQRHNPDLIILDFDLPDIKGPEICEMLKKSNRTHRIPVIFLTSLDNPESVLASYEQGAEIFLTKPIKTAELIEQVETTIREIDDGSIND